MKIINIDRILNSIAYKSSNLTDIVMEIILMIVATTNMSIPLQPVPITLQSVAVLYIGLQDYLRLLQVQFFVLLYYESF